MSQSTPSTLTANAASERLKQTLATAVLNARFRERLLADPRAVLTEAGLPLPARVAVVVEEAPAEQAGAIARRSTPERLVLPLPPLQTDGGLSDAQLDGIVGGNDLGKFLLEKFLGEVWDGLNEVWNGLNASINGKGMSRYT